VNSLLAATGQAILILAVASMAAYALARMEFRGRRLLTVLILATLFIPPGCETPTLSVASRAAYALAGMEFRGRRLLTVLILATLFIPPVSLLLPNYVIVSQLGWLDRLPAVIVPGTAGAFGVFFLRQFFISLPHELEEAALLDGANRWQIFYKGILPLSKPALATLARL